VPIYVHSCTDMGRYDMEQVDEYVNLGQRYVVDLIKAICILVNVVYIEHGFVSHNG